MYSMLQSCVVFRSSVRMPGASACVLTPCHQVVAITSNARVTKEPGDAGARLSLAVLASAADDITSHAVEQSNASV